MVALKDLLDYCNNVLQSDKFKDYCPNGLQVEGKAHINKLVGGVTASQALLDRAVERCADAILVHHGYFWKGEDASICGIKKRRIQRLLQNDISLLGYHLPLDVHPELGNNAQLAQQLDLKVDGTVTAGGIDSLLWYGCLNRVMTTAELCDYLQQRLGRIPMYLPAGETDKPIESIAWCSGAAQGYIDVAADLGVDAYLSGEVSEHSFHQANELNVHYFAAGHHATERYGVQALGRTLSQQFDLDFEFIDIDNPV